MSQAPNAQQPRLIDLEQSPKLLPQYCASKQRTEVVPQKEKSKTAMLSKKYKLFCENYLQDYNGSRAYREVFKAKNGTARVESSKLLTNPDVRAYLDRRTEELTQTLRIQQERTLRELRNVAYSNMLDYVDWGKNGVTLKESAQLTREQGAAVSQITETVTQHGGMKTIKLQDKPEALTRLGQNLRLFEEDKLKDVNISVSVVNVR